MDKSLAGKLRYDKEINKGLKGKLRHDKDINKGLDMKKMHKSLAGEESEPQTQP